MSARIERIVRIARRYLETLSRDCAIMIRYWDRVLTIGKAEVIRDEEEAML